MAEDKLVTQTERLKTLTDLLERYKGALVRAAPKWFNTERALMVARLAYSRQPQLLKCDPLSIVACAAYAAQHGLEISGPGGVHPVPFWNRRRNRLEAQPITDYRGLITLARRSGHVSTFEAQTVYKNDRFDYVYGTKPHLIHRPAEGERGEMVYAYAISRLKDGTYQFEVWDRAQCEHHRDRFSKAAQEGPWVTDFEAMAKKTVARALCKWLPTSVEVQQLIAREEKTEAGEEPEDLTAFLGLELLPENGEEAPKPTGKLGKLTERLEPTKPGGPLPPPSPPLESANGGAGTGVPEPKPGRGPVELPPGQPASEAQTLMGATAGGTIHGTTSSDTTPASGPTAKRPEPSRGADKEGPPAGLASPTKPPPAGAALEREPPIEPPVDRDGVLKEISGLMRGLKTSPAEEQFLWGKFGAGERPVATGNLVKLLDYLEKVQTSVKQIRLPV